MEYRHVRRLRRVFLSAMAILAPALVASVSVGSAIARTIDVGPGQIYKLPSLAARDAHDGDHIRIAPGTYFDCAVWYANDLVIEGIGADASAIITDTTCMGKAIFVIVGNNATVRNLTLTRARVPDMNGAGIRQEGLNLTVEAVKFIDNQDGILGGGPHSRIIVRNSEFIRNGTCAMACAHGIYVGEADLLQVEHSRFFDTREGHHIKSRALRTEVVDCTIADGSEGTSSYLIDVPNGGSLVVRGSRLQKGPRSENHGAAISIGAEGVTHLTGEIIVDGNSFVDDGNYQTVFVLNSSATPAVLRANKLSGQVIPLRGQGSSQ